ncbi:MAG TPA: GNAT family N-acetyltransferase [Marmoricola sp.]|nr:GNAT family N-acetyltransferase [Marmoricola sp.]
MSFTEPGGRGADLTLRPAGPDDVPAIAQVFLGARAAAVPAMPPHVHTDEEVHAYHHERLAAGEELWVAEAAGEVVGYAHVTGGWLDALYVAPGRQGQGIGTAMLDLAKSLRPEGFALWVFVSNKPARRFYRRHGLIELESTDGTGNEEGAPDLRMAWPGADPLGYLRGQVDEVDADLALLLARRTALAVAIQEFKPVPGHAGRDPEREAAIVRRMAEHAPDLDEDALARIMHEVIAAGLDRAEQEG